MPDIHDTHGTAAAYPAGQQLRCDICGAEIAIIKPCAEHPPDQVLQCCGKDMRPPARISSEIDSWQGDT